MTPDRLITHVAREWTAAAPPSNLRARVAARLDARAPRRAVGRVPMTTAAVAAAAAIVIGTGAWLLVPRGTRGTGAVAAVATRAPAADARGRAGARGGDARGGDDRRAKNTDHAGTAALARVTRERRDVLADAGNELPALPEPRPIALVAIQPEGLVLPQLDVQPLELPAPIVVDPIGDGGSVR